MGQRGRKTCPACGESLGVRTRLCQCGHEFDVKVSTRKPKPKAEPAAEPEPIMADMAVKVSSISALRLFIAQLKSKLEAAKRTGGSYSAFLDTNKGKLEVEIHLS